LRIDFGKLGQAALVAVVVLCHLCELMHDHARSVIAWFAC
jgi:hypothetical protein